jgi:hypothetical protein
LDGGVTPAAAQPAALIAGLPAKLIVFAISTVQVELLVPAKEKLSLGK